MIKGVEVVPLAAREAVASGPLFDQQIGRFEYVREDGRCVWLALYEAGGHPAIPMATIDTLIRKNDRGHYADRTNLVRDLLETEETR